MPASRRSPAIDPSPCPVLPLARLLDGIEKRVSPHPRGSTATAPSARCGPRTSAREGGPLRAPVQIDGVDPAFASSDMLGTGSCLSDAERQDPVPSGNVDARGREASALLASNRPRSQQRRRSCRGPRWAETRLLFPSTNIASVRVGRGLGRWPVRRGRARRARLRRRRARARPRCADEPSPNARGIRAVQAGFRRTARPESQAPAHPGASETPPRNARRAAPGHSAAGIQRNREAARKRRQ